MPPIGNEVINLVKDTALVYVLAISELSRVARTHVMRDDTFIPFLIAAIFYLMMTGMVQRFFQMGGVALRLFPLVRRLNVNIRGETDMYILQAIDIHKNFGSLVFCTGILAGAER